jgi:hypothetical protein
MIYEENFRTNQRDIDEANNNVQCDIILSESDKRGLQLEVIGLLLNINKNSHKHLLT